MTMVANFKWFASIHFFSPRTMHEPLICTKPFHQQVTLQVWVIVVENLKDGAYYCYCAYVLRISRYSDFLSPMLTNTGIFLRGLKLSGESRS